MNCLLRAIIWHWNGVILLKKHIALYLQDVMETVSGFGFCYFQVLNVVAQFVSFQGSG